MLKKVHYGVIGCGMMGQEHLSNISLLPQTRVAGIFEPDPEQAGRAAKLAPDAKMVTSIDELLKLPELDCILIASPNYLHLDHLEALMARPLPVLVEKPLLVDVAQLDRLAEFQAAYPAPVWVAMEYRYMPPIAAFLEEARETTGGIKMLTIREHRFPFLDKVGAWNRFNQLTGGTFVEKCCHFFDLMRLALDAEPVRIMASGGQAVNHLDETYDGKTPDIFDNGYVIVDFDSGARAMLELCMFAEGARYQEEIVATGPRGRIEARVPGPTRFWSDRQGPPPVPQVLKNPRTGRPTERDLPIDARLLQAGDHNGSTFYQHERFVAMVRSGKHPEVSLNDGRMSVLMGLAAQKSMLEHRVICFPDLRENRNVRHMSFDAVFQEFTSTTTRPRT